MVETESGVRVTEVPCLERSFNSCGVGPFAKVKRPCHYIVIRGQNGYGNYYCLCSQKR